MSPVLLVGLGAVLVLNAIILARLRKLGPPWRVRVDAPSDLDLLSDKIYEVTFGLRRLTEIVEQLCAAVERQQQAREGVTDRRDTTNAAGTLVSARRVDPELPPAVDESQTAIDEFLDRANAGPLTLEGARGLARARGCRLEVAKTAGAEWRVVAIERVASRGEWLAVPVPRVPMGNAELETWYELSRYSGIDPLKPSQIVKPAVLLQQNGAWSLLAKGRIDGGH